MLWPDSPLPPLSGHKCLETRSGLCPDLPLEPEAKRIQFQSLETENEFHLITQAFGRPSNHNESLGLGKSICGQNRLVGFEWIKMMYKSIVTGVRGERVKTSSRLVVAAKFSRRVVNGVKSRLLVPAMPWPMPGAPCHPQDPRGEGFSSR